jgi:hypothetical protein
MVVAVKKRGRWLVMITFAVWLILLAAGPVMALTNDDCFKCHKETNLAAGGLGGEMRSLFIDKARFMKTLHGQKLACLDCHIKADNKTHLRTGYRQVTCLTCHSQVEAYDPYKVREKLRRKGIKIPEKKMVGEHFLASVHGKALLAGKENAPNCYDCHTIHYPMAAKKAASTVNAAHLQQTCSRCHPERQPRGLFTRLATFRVQAHRKADLTYSYSRTACIDCHQGDAAHGEKELTKAPCRKCHQQKVQPAGLMFGRFHLFPNYDQQHSIWLLRNFYGILFSVLVLLLATWGLYAGLRRIGRYYQQQEEEDEK